MIPDILDLTIPKNDSGKRTVREYLIEILLTLWFEEERFSGKRPFGNSGWQHDLTDVLVKKGFAKDQGSAWVLINETIKNL